MSNVPVEAGIDDVHAHPRHTGHRRFDLVMAICAIFISAVSLVVAIEHGRTERDLVAANSWPFLREDVTNGAGSGKDIAFGVSNGGVGPAKIKSFEISLDGRPVASPADLLAACCGLPRDAEGIKRMLPHGAANMSMVDGTVLRPGEVNDVLTIAQAKADPGLFARLDASLLRLTFKVCYCSVLDQCWTGTLVGTDATPIRVCPPPAHPYDFNGYPKAAAATRPRS